MAEQLRQFDNFVNSNAGFVNSNSIIHTTLQLLFAMYGSYLVPKLTPESSWFFSNTYVRILVFFAVVRTAEKNVGVALMIAMAYFLSARQISQMALKTVAKTGKLTPELVAAINPETGVSPTLPWLGKTPLKDKKAPPGNVHIESALDAPEGPGGLLPYVPDEVAEIAPI